LYLSNKLHKSQTDCNKITQKSRWNRMAHSRSLSSGHRVGVSFKWETPTLGQKRGPKFTDNVFF